MAGRPFLYSTKLGLANPRGVQFPAPITPKKVQNGTYHPPIIYPVIPIQNHQRLNVMNKRATIIVKGRVQKMGYRLMIDRIAFGLDLKGTVENLKDGSVKIICEGPEPNLRTFCKLIKIRKYPVRVDSTRTRLSAATGEFKEFEPLPDEKLDSNPNWKLNLGISNLLDLTDGQVEVLGAIQNMDSHMGTRFDRLDRKYGEFGKTMKGMARDTRKSGKDAKATGGHIKTMARDMNGVKGAMTGIASDIKAIRNTTTAPRKRKTPIPA